MAEKCMPHGGWTIFKQTLYLIPLGNLLNFTIIVCVCVHVCVSHHASVCVCVQERVCTTVCICVYMCVCVWV